MSKIPDTEQGHYGRGVYLSPDKDFIGKYGRKTVEAVVDRKANILDWDTKMNKSTTKQIEGALKNRGVSEDTIRHIMSIPPKPINLYKRIQDILEITPKEASDIFSESGIHGVTVARDGKIREMSIFDDTKIKTKAQLEEIYKKAHKQPLKAEKVEVKADTPTPTDRSLYGYKPQTTNNKIDADMAYKKASDGIGADILNDVSIADIKKILGKKLKVGDIVERLDAVRNIKGSRAYANAKYIEDPNLSNQENFAKWYDIFLKKLNDVPY